MFVIAASDGLWDKCGNTEAVNIVHDTGAHQRWQQQIEQRSVTDPA